MNYGRLAIVIIGIIILSAVSGCGGGGNGGGGSTLPSPWLHRDIGTGMPAGSASYQNGTFTITGAGNILPLNKDQLHFVYQTINGDFTIIARITSMQKTKKFASAGLMIRNNLEPNSQMVKFYVSYISDVSSPPYHCSFGSRMEIDSNFSSGGEDIQEIPIYLKLVRNGNVFSGFYSADGNTWTPSFYNSYTVAMSDPVYVGMFVFSYDENTLETDTFDNVAISKS